jgi:uncharacterized protein (DUF2062 family)
MSDEALAAPTESFVQRRLVKPILALLRQGITPEKIALSLAMGVVCGLFPIMGATTLLCMVAAFCLGLNQIAVQIVNYVMSPFQVGGILFFVRLGEWLVGAAPLPLSPLELLRRFQEDPLASIRSFGVSGVHAIVGWSVIAPFLAAALYALAVPVLRRAAAQMQASRTSKPSS